MDPQPSSLLYQQFDEEALYVSQEDPEEKVINELYKYLLPGIIESWEEKLCPKRMEFLTAASDVSLSNPDPCFLAEVKFKSGNKYRGDVKDKRLHGNGIYYWIDGASYEGTFRENRLEGEGKITYSGGQRYSGQVSYGYHHGHGVFISDAVKYGGEFEGGLLHGKGSLVTTEGTFDGIFQNDKISAGTRKYDDGLFVGKFNTFGERCEGCFLAKNGDVYNGCWQQDHYSEFGIYRWCPPLNCNKLMMPLGNFYVGYWACSYQCGPGVLHFDDRMILGSWRFGYKIGMGAIIAANGDAFVGEKMFMATGYRDVFKVKRSGDADEHILVLRKIMSEATKLSFQDEAGFYNIVESLEWIKPFVFDTVVSKEVNYLSASAHIPEIPPTFLAKHMIDLESTPIVDFVADYLPEVDRETLQSIESKSISQVIASQLKILDQMYTKLARYGQETTTSYPICMLRLSLWRFLRTIINFDPKFNTVKFLNEAEHSFHLTTEDPSDPYEVLYFWQFLKYILCLTMHLNRNPMFAAQALEKRPPYFGLFGTMLVIFLQEYEKLADLTADNLPKLVNADACLVMDILDLIKEYQPNCLIRKTYNIFKEVCGKLISLEAGEAFLTFDDYVQCISEVYPSAVRDGILIHVDDLLTSLEVFEIIVVLVVKSLRNKKYQIEKEKFVVKFFKKLLKQKEEAEMEKLKQLLENPPDMVSKKKKQK